MTTATITEVKNSLSAFLDRVREGETVLILDRGTPVARLEPVHSDAESSGRLRRLERAGLVATARKRMPLEMLRQPGPRPSGRASAVEALLEERRGDR